MADREGVPTPNQNQQQQQQHQQQIQNPADLQQQLVHLNWSHFKPEITRKTR